MSTEDFSLQTISVRSWQEFEDQLTVLKSSRASLPDPKGLLFRGQTHSEWPLETTLERVIGSGHCCLMAKYYEVICGIIPDIETFTEHEIEYPSDHEIDRFCHTYESRHAFALSTMPAFGYLVYLRHHGFPSPLLDWTRSPYIAAYFAFAKCRRDYACDSVAIYANQGESVQGSSHIYSLWRNVKSHRRHFVQQAAYTMCANFICNDWKFSKYEKVACGNGQYVINKFIISMAEK